MKIMKFGGTSVKSAKEIQCVIEIIKNAYESTHPPAVVVSALGGVTDALIQMGKKVADCDKTYLSDLQELKDRHSEAANRLTIDFSFDQLFKELKDVLLGVQLLRELSDRTLDLIKSFGERFSATLIAGAIKKTYPDAIFVDMRQLIKTNHKFGHAQVNESLTSSNIRSFFKQNPKALPIMTGFIASTENNQTTTLGRGGSDLTASLVAAATQADVVEIWTDVDGVMTADPRIVRQASSIPEMSYNEMLELSYFGTKVLHPPTVIPALEHKIPIIIKNTFNPSHPGTRIAESHNENEGIIRGITAINGIALLSVEGSGMVGTTGIASRLFSALAKRDINVIIITQCSSEHSICFAVEEKRSTEAKETVEKVFALEIQVNYIDKVTIETSLSIIAVVGDSMNRTPGIAGQLFGILGKNGINIRAIAQGSSELNITCVITKKDEAKALNVIHDSFFLPSSTLHVFLVGTGLIGSMLLSQIQQQWQYLIDEYAIDIRLTGIANSKKMVFDPGGIPLDSWKKVLQNSKDSMSLSNFIYQMQQYNLSNAIFIDCTASLTIAECYHQVLGSNISIVTPNKKANSGNYATYCNLRSLARQKSVNFLYETNVGAGLPIIGTINSMMHSGDKILQIEGILSGTLSYLFNTFDGTSPFSKVVVDAQKKGFTEPDPRDDLNGMDVARKLLILIRESGYVLELDEIEMEPFLPSSCFDAKTIDDFFEILKQCDQEMLKRFQKASLDGKMLRYMAIYKNGKAKIGLQAVSQDHAFYHLSGNDNIIAFTTKRYHENPMVIKGQGAGADVTAGEIFSDIIRVGREIKDVRW